MIQVDISNIWGRLSLQDLLAMEAQTAEAHGGLPNGGLPRSLGKEMLNSLLVTADWIRAYSDVLVVVGTDQDCMEARCAISLLWEKLQIQVLFTGNDLSPRAWQQLLRQLEGKSISLCVLSRSGEDREAALAFRNLRWHMERRYGTDEARSRIYVVTGDAQGTLARMAQQEKWKCFLLPDSRDWGLLPMAAAGLDIRAMLRGEAKARKAYDLRSFENPLWLYAAVRVMLLRRGKKLEVLSGFEPGFRDLGRWWQQRFAREGDLFPAVAELPGDQDLLERWMQAEHEAMLETQVRFDPPEQPVKILRDAKCQDGQEALAGKTLQELEAQASAETLNRHVDAQVPVVTIGCGPLDEKTLGGLFHFFRLAEAVSGRMTGAPSGEEKA